MPPKPMTRKTAATKRISAQDSLASEQALRDSNADNDYSDEQQQQSQSKRQSRLAGKKRGRHTKDEKTSKLLAKSDDECDDDELIDKLEAQSKLKPEKVDLDGMTKRQRLKYLQDQADQPQSSAVSITTSGLDQLTGGENVLYSLGSKRAKTTVIGEDGLPIAKPKKTQISQQQADELKRKQLDMILEEQQKKVREREEKMKLKQTGVMANAGIGRPATAALHGNARWRPGMEQFANAIKLKSTGNKQLLCMPQGFLLPEVLRQKPASELQKKIDQRRKESDCYSCNKKDARKYVCSQTKRVTCSFECYKAVKAM